MQEVAIENLSEMHIHEYLFLSFGNFLWKCSLFKIKSEKNMYHREPTILSMNDKILPFRADYSPTPHLSTQYYNLQLMCNVFLVCLF